MSEAVPLPENVLFHPLTRVLGWPTVKTHIDGETQEARSRNRVSALRGSLKIKPKSRSVVPAEAVTLQPLALDHLPT